MAGAAAAGRAWRTVADAVGGLRLRIASYNILAAPPVGTPGHFPHVQPDLMDWAVRKERVAKVMAELDSDVLCCQELSDYPFFKAAMEAEGYESVYAKRPSTTVSSWSGREKNDGCAIFFRRDRLELTCTDSINFDDKHDRCALLAVLRDRSTEGKASCLVVTTHLYWDQSKPDEQLFELRQVEGFVKASNATEPISLPCRPIRLKDTGRLPVLFCGDLNSVPGSPVYKEATNSFLSDEGYSLDSAYVEYCQQGSEPPHTTVTPRRASTIDHILHSQHVRVARLLELPREADMRTERGPDPWFTDEKERRLQAGADSETVEASLCGLPSREHPSDHLPIMAEVVLEPPEGTE